MACKVKPNSSASERKKERNKEREKERKDITWEKCYKTFYGCNLQLFIIS